jgi:RHS repeat-associated protein
VARYVQGPGIDQPLVMLRGSTTDYYEQDGLGSVTSLSDGAGALAQTYTYGSFGNTTNSSGSVTNFFRYTGREFDTETNLSYNRARYYDPATGRFLNEDSIRFSGGINFYAYTRNNPANFADPLGLCPASPPPGPILSPSVCNAVTGVLTYASIVIIPIEAVPNPVGAGLAIVGAVFYFGCL